MNIAQKLMNIFMGLVVIILITLGIHTLINIFIPLSKIENTEVNKSKVIGLISTSSMEFDENNNPFWWIVREGSELKFTNYSDEPLIGKIVLKFEDNPCKNLQLIDLGMKNSIRQYRFINPETTIEFEIVFEKRETIKLILKTTQFNDCYQYNGDTRNFGAKLIYWGFI